MRFALSTALVALLGLASVQAACHSRRSLERRSLARRSTIPPPPSTGESLAAPVVKKEKTVVRRQKGGARLDRQGGRAPWEDRKDASGGSASSTAPLSAMTTPAGEGSKATQTQAKASTTQTSEAQKSSSTSSSSSSSSSASSSTYTGAATFYYQNGNAGACGSTNADSAKIVALQTTMYGSGESCGKTVYITNTANGKSVTATVADECPSCESSSSLDLSTGAFDAIGDESTGELDIEWYFTD